MRVEFKNNKCKSNKIKILKSNILKAIKTTGPAGFEPAIYDLGGRRLIQVGPRVQKI